MMPEYQELNLDELGFLGRGKSRHRPRNDPALYGGAYPFIQTGDVKAAELHVQEHSETYNEIGLAQSKLWDKGTLLITIAANIAETAVLDVKACFPDSVVGFVPDENRVNAYYVKYYIDFIKREMQSISQGTTQDNLSLEKLRLFKFKVPPKETVDAITNVLLSYDNLIENNNRRIAILEEMAQSLYREWFVKFRFPGHQQAKFIGSPLGKIPKGWEIMSASNTIDINPRTPLQREGEKPFVPMGSLSASSMVISDIQMKGGNSGVKFINRDTLFARITPCLQNGKTGYVQFLTQETPVGFGSTEFIVLREDVVPAEYIYCLARSDFFRESAIKSMTGATGRQRVSNACFDAFMISVAPNDLMSKFCAVTKPMFDQILNLSKRKTNLVKQRNLMLPKLISGNIKL